MRRRLAVARRELGSLRREKTIVLAVAIQLFVAAFSSFLVVGLVALYSPTAAGGAAVTVGVTGNASADFASAVGDGDGYDLVGFESRERGQRAFRDGDLAALLEVTRRPAGNVSVDATVAEGNFRTTLAVVQLKSMLAEYERHRREQLRDRLVDDPLPVPPAPDANPYFGFTYTVLLPLLMFLPAFISGSITADSLAEEIERGTLELLRVSPLSPAAIVDGKLLATVGLAPVQAAAWIALLTVNGTPVARPLPILVLVAATTTLAAGAGALLALRFEERRSAQLLYSFLLLGLFSLSVLLPENLANAVAKLAVGSPTPATYGLVAGLVALALVGYAAVRRAADRTARG